MWWFDQGQETLDSSLAGLTLLWQIQLLDNGWHTGRSLTTVDCIFFLTDPKTTKNAITQRFLESWYREILIFCCFKTVRCIEFCLQSFSNNEHLLRLRRPYHSYIPLYAFKPHKHIYTSPICSETAPPGISGQFRSAVYQMTPTDLPWHQKRLFKDVWWFVLTLNGLCCWHQPGVC